MSHAALPFASLIDAAAPVLMGIVNVTPDSFSDGGEFFDADAAAARARELVGQGAGVIDLGAEASSFFRSGVEAVPAEEQIRRLRPVLERLRDVPVVISVDTRSAAVARFAIALGARIINDVSAGMHEPEIVDVVADSDAGMILMHMSAGYPATPAADDVDIVAHVREGLAAAMGRAGKIPAARIALDPGVGFGKTMADNWRLALRAAEIVPAGMSQAVVLGVSRKRFLETAPPADVQTPEGWETLVGSLQGDHPRDAQSAALTGVAARRGVMIHRVHDVGLAARSLAMIDTVMRRDAQSSTEDF